MDTIKEVDLGNGLVIKVASFSYDQVEEMLTSPAPPLNDAKAQKEAAWTEVLTGLNNAGADGQGNWTRESVKQVLCDHFPALQANEKFSELRLAILEASGYEIKKKPDPTPISQAA